ncbi:lipopolysaccharide biosynthesis protein [Labrys okinawensis]|uniref:lipopolysaccharide biosynthesis protein n=1 Tax=Labrys okinawensis TaxID=346911 RepID=UPI0039BD72D0
MNEITPVTPEQHERSLERAKNISTALTDAARRARFSNRSKEAFFGRASARRRAATLLIRRVLFALVVIIPNAASISYYGFIASDQFESEAKFTVSSGALPKMDDIGSATGVPPVTILQDTMIVVSYIESQAMVAKLQDTVTLRKIYSADTIDRWSRFQEDQPIEKFTAYWNKFSSAAVTYPSGVVTLRVRAFNAADAQRVAASVISECESMINQLNDRMFRDTVSDSEKDVAAAADALKTARINYEKARNDAGVIDVKSETAHLYSLLTDLQGQLLKAQSDYNTRLASLSPQAPQMRLLKQKVASLTTQVTDAQAKITEAQKGSTGDEALSQKLGQFSNLELEQKIAEARYAEASASLNMARLVSERKLLYIHPIVEPAVAEEAKYPRRKINIGLVLLVSVLAWLVSVSAVSYLRRRIA